MTEKSKVREEEWRVRERDLEDSLLEGEKERLALKDTIYLLESQLRDSSLQTDGVQVFSPLPPFYPSITLSYSVFKGKKKDLLDCPNVTSLQEAGKKNAYAMETIHEIIPVPFFFPSLSFLFHYLPLYPSQYLLFFRLPKRIW
jgi:hypothetical protein